MLVTIRNYFRRHTKLAGSGSTGDIRIGLANRGYGPLIAGPEGHRTGDLR